MPAVRTVHIEFCASCGYTRNFAEVKAAIEAAFPGQVTVVANATPPRMKTFEVVLDDGTLVFSKLTTHKYPDPQEIVALLTAALSSGGPSAGKVAQYTGWPVLPLAITAVTVSVCALVLLSRRRRM